MKRNHAAALLGAAVILGAAFLAQAYPRATRPALSFTGTLKQGGQAVQGAQSLTFRFKKGTAELCAPVVGNVTPESGSGRFSVEIPLDGCPPALFDGSQVTVDVLVGGEVVASDQAINPVPYARYADVAAAVVPLPVRPLRQDVQNMAVTATDWTPVLDVQPAVAGNVILLTSLSVVLETTDGTQTAPAAGGGRLRYTLLFQDNTQLQSEELSARFVNTPNRVLRHLLDLPALRCGSQLVGVRVEARSNGTGPINADAAVTGVESVPSALPPCRPVSHSRPVPVETTDYTTVATFNAPAGKVWTPRQVGVRFDYDMIDATDASEGEFRVTFTLPGGSVVPVRDHPVGLPIFLFGTSGMVTFPINDGFISEVTAVTIETRLGAGQGRAAVAFMEGYEFDDRR